MPNTTQAGAPRDGEHNARQRGEPTPPVAELSAPSIRAQLEKILASEAFSHSGRLRRFLRFTVEEALKGEGLGLKEYQIGVEVFDRKDSYDTRLDPIVRVEAGRLRSKLKEFYDVEGRDDPVSITLQKGSYVPVFQKRRPTLTIGARLREWSRGLRDRKNVAVLVSALMVVIAISWGVASHRESLALRSQLEAASQRTFPRALTPIWGQFFTLDAPNFVVFGSPVFFASERETLFLRWGGLREPADFLSDPRLKEMEKRLGPLEGPRHDYALMGDARALQRLTAFFGAGGGRIRALPAHEANWDTIKGGNIIFLGAPRMIPLLDRLPVQQDFEWDADHNVVNHNPQPGEQKKYITASHYDETSYAIIGCFPGLRPNREILLLTAHSAPGIMAAVDYLTQPESVRVLLQKLGLSESTGHRHYQLLLRIVVDRGNEVKSEYVTHHLLPTPAVGP